MLKSKINLGFDCDPAQLEAISTLKSFASIFHHTLIYRTTPA